MKWLMCCCGLRGTVARLVIGILLFVIAPTIVSYLTRGVFFLESAKSGAFADLKAQGFNECTVDEYFRICPILKGCDYRDSVWIKVSCLDKGGETREVELCRKEPFQSRRYVDEGYYIDDEDDGMRLMP